VKVRAPSDVYYQLVLDGTRCEGHGICALRCPERVTLDEWGYANVDPAFIEDARTLARSRRAARACPSAALTLVARDDRPATDRPRAGR
jgi:ferredoxin